MNAALMTMLSVPVPDLPQRPDGYAHPPAFWVLMWLGIVTICWFTAVVCRVILTERLWPGAIRASKVTAAVALTSILAMVFLMSTEEERSREVHRDHRALELTVERDVIVQIEQAYGVTFEGVALVPLYPRETMRTDLVLPDGRTDRCAISAGGTHYTIVCGLSGQTEGTPLDPLDADG